MFQRIKNFLTVYSPSVPYVYVYMLQQVEYDASQFLAWVSRAPDYRRIMKRKKLVYTKKAVSMIFISYFISLAGLLSTVFFVVKNNYMFASLVFFITPIVSALFLAVIAGLGNLLLRFKRKTDISEASLKMSQSKAIKIAVIGSYGKTTMKEFLGTILSSNKKVAVTPGNRNVAISHARWINNNLDGDEDIIVFEYGEYRPGDIAELAQLTCPNFAVITGFAPNHLDTYKNVGALKVDLASIKNFVDPDKIFAFAQAASELELNLSDEQIFDANSALGWKITIDSSGFHGLHITLKKDKNTIKLNSGLLGRHLAPPLAFAATFAQKLGIDNKSISEAVSNIKPFEHRLSPVHINGAWIIDDTYNGNLEGIKAGLALLKELPAKRKIYVTPGLVEQGQEKESVHREIADHIITTDPDEVVLMNNSATEIIMKALRENEFKGTVTIEENPLNYYEYMSYKLSAGDVVLMQNDWTDNYN